MPLDYRQIYKRALALLTPIGLASIFLLQAGCGLIILSHPRASELVNRSSFSWTKDITEHFDLFCEAESKTAGQVAAVRIEAEQEWEKVLTFLKEEQYDQRVSIFLVQSKQRMKDLIGLSISATGFNQTNKICLIPHSSPPSNVGLLSDAARANHCRDRAARSSADSVKHALFDRRNLALEL